MRLARILCPLIATAFAAASPAMAQQKPPPPSSAQPAATASQPAPGQQSADLAAVNDAAPAGDKPDFKPEELDQMLAAIALYPDSLISQILMASTYPVEVVEAERWTKAKKDLKGDALAKELEKKSWDASVKSLVQFPQVLAMMSENLSTTVKIGDAFIGQQKEVMEAVQRLRAKAKSTGNLESGKEQTVKTETSSAGTQVIVIESSNPDVVYVPQYSPTVVYGSWPYPAYPPAPYYPPGYGYHPVATFAAGGALGAAWGYAWGNCNWGGGDVNIDIDRNSNRNTNIDRNKARQNNGGRGQGNFKHNPSHRQGAAYRNQGAASKVGAGNNSARTSQAQNQFRGKAEAGRADINRGGADGFKGNSPSSRQGAGAGRPAGSAGAGRPNTGAGGGARPQGSGGAALNRSGESARRGSGGQQSWIGQPLVVSVPLGHPRVRVVAAAAVAAAVAVVVADWRP